MAIADAIESMLSDRPYRRALDLEAVIKEIKRYSGSQFDPHVVEAAIPMLEKHFCLGESNCQTQAEVLPKWRTSTPSS